MNCFQSNGTETTASSSANSKEERSRNCPTHQKDDGSLERPSKRCRPSGHLEETTDGPFTEVSASPVDVSGVGTRQTSSASHRPEDDHPRIDAVLIGASREQPTENAPVQSDGGNPPTAPDASTQPQDTNMSAPPLRLDGRDWDAEFRDIDMDFMKGVGDMSFLEDDLFAESGLE